MNSQVHCSKFCPLGGFPFTTVLHKCPRKVYSVISVHFLVMPGYCVKASWSQAWGSLPPAVIRELPVRPQVHAGRVKAVWQEWGWWAFGPLLHITYLCLQGPLRPNLMYVVSIWWWNIDVHSQLYGLMDQITSDDESVMGISDHM